MKYFFSLICCFAFFSNLFSYDYEAKRHTTQTTRSRGIGKQFSADFESFFTLFSNPAGMPFLGDLPFNEATYEIVILNEKIAELENSESSAAQKKELKQLKKKRYLLQYPGRLYPSIGLNVGGPLQDLFQRNTALNNYLMPLLI
ncbi:MAG: hypothetical protein ACRC5H_01770 [Treponemataceae bacterium]